MSQFAFLRQEWTEVADAAARAERLVHADARASCFYSRRALELAVHWAFKHDAALKLPYQDNISALIHEPSFKQSAGEAIFNKARVINTLGNRAVHGSKPVPTTDAEAAIKELFHLGYWLAHTYARGPKPPADLRFDPAALPKPQDRKPDPQGRQTAEQLQKLDAELRSRDENLARVLADRSALDAELVRLRVEVAEIKKAAAAQPDTHDYSEAETRDYFIDLLLKEAGWPLDQPRDREFEVTGMPNRQNTGYVDYVLWGDDGKPLGVVEAKRTRRDPRAGQQQAKLYADCLEARFGQRPVIFYSNGYDHWIWDDEGYPARAVQGFYKKGELELLIQRRTTRTALSAATINPAIVERHYQTRGIRKIAESFERDKDRRALLVMATGSGKTRTVIALADLMMRCNWAKRVLFLADRVALVNQAVNAFKIHLPDVPPVNLVTEKDADGRVFVSTYPTMMGLINEARDGQRRFGVGHFDLIVIDEAHRSVFQKYRAIFDYFDALLVGLTATPRDEIDRNTYSLFELEDGVPTDAYSLEEAVRDGYLVPATGVSVPLKFQRDGIKYDDLSEDDKDQWDALEWDEDGAVPDKVEAAAVNKWFFNKDTVDKVLAHLMTHGQAVSGGDRLGKTILFAKNQDHADYIADRFNANYPHYRGEFARVITFKTEYAQTLIDAFSNRDRAPHIAISVDMLDTGIDVPEVVNLVFFKLVRSKTKFWQMVGRGTRLCSDLFGPGRDKKSFSIFDYCQNLEYFNQNLDGQEGAAAPSLGKRLFVGRMELIAELDKRAEPDRPADHARETPTAVYGDPRTERELRLTLADTLRTEVGAMNIENFVVRPHRRIVERYTDGSAWTVLTPAAIADLATQVAGLPAELEAEPEESKRFDLLLLNLQLASAKHEPSFERLRDQLKSIAGLLEEKAAIPGVRAQMVLIQDVQSDEWWQDVTLPMLERVRRKFRELVVFIEKRQRKPLFTDFEDVIGAETAMDLPGFQDEASFARFRAKAEAFLKRHLDHITIQKLRFNKALTPSDLAELERMLAENGVGGPADILRAKQESEGLGLFVRSMVGLDRGAAKQALDGFLAGRTLSGDQIEFVNLIVNHLTEHGVMAVERLYESPFTDISPHGPDAMFDSAAVDQLVEALRSVRRTAEAA